MRGGGRNAAVEKFSLDDDDSEPQRAARREPTAGREHRTNRIAAFRAAQRRARARVEARTSIQTPPSEITVQQQPSAGYDSICLALATTAIGQGAGDECYSALISSGAAIVDAFAKGQINAATKVELLKQVLRLPSGQAEQLLKEHLIAVHPIALQQPHPNHSDQRWFGAEVEVKDFNV